MTERLVQLLDMSKGYTSEKDGTLMHNSQVVDRGEMCYFPAPFEFPAYLRFWRRIERTLKGKHDSSKHLGTTLEVDVFPFGVKVYVRWDMPLTGTGGLKVIVEDADGMTTVASYERA